MSMVATFVFFSHLYVGYWVLNICSEISWTSGFYVGRAFLPD